MRPTVPPMTTAQLAFFAGFYGIALGMPVYLVLRHGSATFGMVFFGGCIALMAYVLWLQMNVPLDAQNAASAPPRAGVAGSLVAGYVVALVNPVMRRLQGGDKAGRIATLGLPFLAIAVALAVAIPAISLAHLLAP
ncbi:hypothetical protein AADZ90_009110 [Aestuariibius sp. 2305UL40-4]|uniref:hypothetical protein n=1 Tax=Aestuariibius violaceus TaxID=3234132 RepID=UPI00345E278A